MTTDPPETRPLERQPSDSLSPNVETTGDSPQQEVSQESKQLVVPSEGPVAAEITVDEAIGKGPSCSFVFGSLVDVILPVLFRPLTTMFLYLS